MRTTRSRVLSATRERVWEVVGDPYHEPRWWPRVQRVEAVSKQGWTSVMTSPKCAAVRADWTLETSRTPEFRRWAQQLDGTAFERVFKRNAVEVALERGDHAAGATTVTLTIDQELRGFARFAPWMVRGAMKRNLDTALDNLAEAIG
jgi:carbon monoxide dehydrogenase subunit G